MSTPTAGSARASVLVIAVDGPSGAGKSSAARGVARRLGLRYLDTGAMYRAMTWWVLEHGIDASDEAAVTAVVSTPDIVAGTDPASPTITVDGLDVSASIRGRAVSAAVSPVAAVPAARARLTALQRRVIGDGGIVVEGRDIGTVVAPDAAVKIYLTADPTARAQRRSAELAHDPAVTVEVAAENLAQRDAIDSSRATAPLAKAADAVELDTTSLTLDEVVDAVLALVKERTDVG